MKTLVNIGTALALMLGANASQAWNPLDLVVPYSEHEEHEEQEKKDKEEKEKKEAQAAKDKAELEKLRNQNKK